MTYQLKKIYIRCWSLLRKQDGERKKRTLKRASDKLAMGFRLLSLLPHLVLLTS